MKKIKLNGAKYICQIPKKFARKDSKLIMYPNNIIITNPKYEPMRLNQKTNRWNKMKVKPKIPQYCNYINVYKSRINAVEI